MEDLVEDLVDEVDWDDYNPPLFRQEYGRLIRSPLKKKGHVILDTCQSDGHLTRSVLAKSEVWQVPTLYSALRKLRWGGIIPVLPLQQQQQRGPLAEAHNHFISDEMLPGEEKETGFMPSSFMGQSPMSKKSAAMEPPIKVVVPPPVTVGRRSPIWKEGEGLKKNDRNRHYQGQGGLVMDEDRGYEDGMDFQESDDMEDFEKQDDDDEMIELGGQEEREEEEGSAWDEDDDDDEDAGFADDEDDDMPQAKLDSMSKDLNTALGRLRKGDLPMPEDVGKERFFPEDVYSDEDDDDDQFGENYEGGEGGDNSSRGELSSSELADMDILKQLRQHHSLDSLTEGEGGGDDMKNIEWEKVFADLQKDGAFDDIDMSALEELESTMKGSDWNDFQGDGDDDEEMNGSFGGENGLDMEAFAKMLQPDELNVEASSPSVSVSGRGAGGERRRAVSRRQKREEFEVDGDDDEEEAWQRGVEGERRLMQ